MKRQISEDDVVSKRARLADDVGVTNISDNVTFQSKNKVVVNSENKFNFQIQDTKFHKNHKTQTLTQCYLRTCSDKFIATKNPRVRKNIFSDPHGFDFDTEVNFVCYLIYNELFSFLRSFVNPEIEDCHHEVQQILKKEEEGPGVIDEEEDVDDEEWQKVVKGESRKRKKEKNPEVISVEFGRKEMEGKTRKVHEKSKRNKNDLERKTHRRSGKDSKVIGSNQEPRSSEQRVGERSRRNIGLFGQNDEVIDRRLKDDNAMQDHVNDDAVIIASVMKMKINDCLNEVISEFVHNDLIDHVLKFSEMANNTKSDKELFEKLTENLSRKDREEFERETAKNNNMNLPEPVPSVVEKPKFVLIHDKVIDDKEPVPRNSRQRSKSVNLKTPKRLQSGKSPVFSSPTCMDLNPNIQRMKDNKEMAQKFRNDRRRSLSLNKVKCDYCDERFSNSRDLNKHKDRVHAKPDAEKSKKEVIPRAANRTDEEKKSIQKPVTMKDAIDADGMTTEEIKDFLLKSFDDDVVTQEEEIEEVEIISEVLSQEPTQETPKRKINLRYSEENNDSVSKEANSEKKRIKHDGPGNTAPKYTSTMRNADLDEVFARVANMDAEGMDVDSSFEVPATPATPDNTRYHTCDKSAFHDKLFKQYQEENINMEKEVEEAREEKNLLEDRIRNLLADMDEIRNENLNLHNDNMRLHDVTQVLKEQVKDLELMLSQQLPHEIEGAKDAKESKETQEDGLEQECKVLRKQFEDLNMSKIRVDHELVDLKADKEILNEEKRMMEGKEEEFEERIKSLRDHANEMAERADNFEKRFIAHTDSVTAMVATNNMLNTRITQLEAENRKLLKRIPCRILGCPKTDCPYGHDKDLKKKEDQVRPCAFFAVGKCRFGDKCKSFHPQKPNQEVMEVKEKEKEKEDKKDQEKHDKKEERKEEKEKEKRGRSKSNRRNRRSHKSRSKSKHQGNAQDQRQGANVGPNQKAPGARKGKGKKEVQKEAEVLNEAGKKTTNQKMKDLDTKKKGKEGEDSETEYLTILQVMEERNRELEQALKLRDVNAKELTKEYVNKGASTSKEA